MRCFILAAVFIGAIPLPALAQPSLGVHVGVLTGSGEGIQQEGERESLLRPAAGIELELRHHHLAANVGFDWGDVLTARELGVRWYARSLWVGGGIANVDVGEITARSPMLGAGYERGRIYVSARALRFDSGIRRFGGASGTVAFLMVGARLLR